MDEIDPETQAFLAKHNVQVDRRRHQALHRRKPNVLMDDELPRITVLVKSDRDGALDKTFTAAILLGRLLGGSYMDGRILQRLWRNFSAEGAWARHSPAEVVARLMQHPAQDVRDALTRANSNLLFMVGLF